MVKKEVGVVEALPSKRLFQSIIADYDQNRSICELIDNAIDIWLKNGKSGSLSIDVNMNTGQQIIRVVDNSGGIKKGDLSLVVAPGQTGNDGSGKIIGIFGVGTKRAVVALSQEVRITTRYCKEKTHCVEFDDSWIQRDDGDWTLPLYETDQIHDGTTEIEMNKLRTPITEESISKLKVHLGLTYAKFLDSNNLKIRVNEKEIEPISFENWAFPPDYSPRRVKGITQIHNGKEVEIEILAGLSRESSPQGGDYGVYFYCNDRLIASALKDYEVGFVKGMAGNPQWRISIVKVIVNMKGDSSSMPWNSSKSGINYAHPVFVAIRNKITNILTYYATLARRLEGNWDDKVFKYDKGTIEEIDVDDFPRSQTEYLAPLPRVRPNYKDEIESANRVIAVKKPWTRGIYETMIAIDKIQKMKLKQANRIILILLDSTLEIAFKEYLVREQTSQYYNDNELSRLFRNRHDVETEVKRHITSIVDEEWGKINYYHDMRSKLIHQRASIDIDDDQLSDFRELTEDVLEKLIGLKFKIFDDADEK